MKTVDRWAEDIMRKVEEQKRRTIRLKSINIISVAAAAAVVIGGGALLLNISNNVDTQTGQNDSSLVTVKAIEDNDSSTAIAEKTTAEKTQDKLYIDMNNILCSVEVSCENGTYNNRFGIILIKSDGNVYFKNNEDGDEFVYDLYNNLYDDQEQEKVIKLGVLSENELNQLNEYISKTDMKSKYTEPEEMPAVEETITYNFNLYKKDGSDAEKTFKILEQGENQGVIGKTKDQNALAAAELIQKSEAFKNAKMNLGKLFHYDIDDLNMDKVLMSFIQYETVDTKTDSIGNLYVVQTNGIYVIRGYFDNDNLKELYNANNDFFTYFNSICVERTEDIDTNKLQEYISKTDTDSEYVQNEAKTSGKSHLFEFRFFKKDTNNKKKAFKAEISDIDGSVQYQSKDKNALAAIELIKNTKSYKDAFENYSPKYEFFYSTPKTNGYAKTQQENQLIKEIKKALAGKRKSEASDIVLDEKTMSKKEKYLTIIFPYCDEQDIKLADGTITDYNINLCIDKDGTCLISCGGMTFELTDYDNILKEIEKIK